MHIAKKQHIRPKSWEHGRDSGNRPWEKALGGARFWGSNPSPPLQHEPHPLRAPIRERHAHRNGEEKNRHNGHEPGAVARFFHRMRDAFSFGSEENKEAAREGAANGAKARSEAVGRAGNNGKVHESKAILEIEKLVSAMDIVAMLPVPPNDGFAAEADEALLIRGAVAAEQKLLERNIAALELVREGLLSRRAGSSFYTDFFVKIQGARSSGKIGLAQIVACIDSHLEGKDMLAVLPNVRETELGAAIAAVEAACRKLREAEGGLAGKALVP